MAEDGKEKRGGGLKALAGTVRQIAKPILGRQGFLEADLIERWEEVVGPSLAQVSLPSKVVFARGESGQGSLHLLVASGAAALSLQHAEPQIIERVNGFFGWRAISKLSLVQGPLPGRAKPAKPVPRALAPEDQAALEGTLAKVEDPELKAALAGLGRAILSKPPGKSK
jgi:hypothetical protein